MTDKEARRIGLILEIPTKKCFPIISDEECKIVAKMIGIPFIKDPPNKLFNSDIDKLITAPNPARSVATDDANSK